MKKSVLRYGVPVLLLAYMIGVGWAEEEGAPPDPSQAQAAVRTATAVEGSLPLSIHALATVVPASASPTRVVARSAGLVLRVAVSEGDRVTSGTTVAVLDPRAADAALRRAEADYRQAESELAAAQNGGLDATQQELDATASGLEAASNQLKKEADRLAALAKEGMASEKAVSDAEAAAKSAGESAAVAATKASRFRSVERAAELVRRRAALVEARSAVETARIESESMTVTAPADGVIGKIVAQPGDRLDAGSAVAELAAVAGWRLSIPVAARDANDLKPGAQLTVEVAGADVGGRVTSVAQGLDTATGLVPVFASIEETTATLRLGMVLPASLRTHDSKPGVLVPAAALSFDEDQAVVTVAEGGHAKVIPVEVLARGKEQVCVEGEGLEAGASIIVDGNDNLPDGAGIVIGDAAHE